MDPVDYSKLEAEFATGATSGLDGVIAELRCGPNHHALFRMLLLKKRFELGLPLVNPGDLRSVAEGTRKIYEDFVEVTCREIGGLYLQEKNIPQAWRYFKTISDREPIRQALSTLDASSASDEVLAIALDEGVDRRRGFELTLQRHGVCRAISLFEQDFSIDIADKQHAAALLARTLYRDLVTGIRMQIMERYGEMPPETDLVDLILHRPWLFEKGHTHADPQHVAAVSRIGLLAADREDLIMTLSIAEYGRMLHPDHQPPPRPPFEEGHKDCALYARALLGQDEAKTLEYFRGKLAGYTPVDFAPYAAEMVVLLFWRVGRKSEALDLWQMYLSDQPPELPGICIPPFYNLCIDAGEFSRLAEIAKKQSDLPAWAAAKILAAPAAVKPAAVPASDESLS
jgi:hypothetical protein